MKECLYDSQNTDNKSSFKEIFIEFIHNFLFVSWKNRGEYNNKVMLSSPYAS